MSLCFDRLISKIFYHVSPYNDDLSLILLNFNFQSKLWPVSTGLSPSPNKNCHLFTLGINFSCHPKWTLSLQALLGTVISRQPSGIVMKHVFMCMCVASLRVAHRNHLLLCFLCFIYIYSSFGVINNNNDNRNSGKWMRVCVMRW